MEDPQERSTWDENSGNSNILFGCFCGLCCGGIGAFPMLNFEGTTNRHKKFIYGLIAGGFVLIVFAFVEVIYAMNKY